MTVKEMGAARHKLGGLLALAQNRLSGKSAVGWTREINNRSPQMNYAPDRRGFVPFLLGVFLICMCGLMLQIVETRVISVIVYYHVAFFCDQHGDAWYDRRIFARILQA